MYWGSCESLCIRAISQTPFSSPAFYVCGYIYARDVTSVATFTEALYTLFPCCSIERRGMVDERGCTVQQAAVFSTPQNGGAGDLVIGAANGMSFHILVRCLATTCASATIATRAPYISLD